MRRMCLVLFLAACDTTVADLGKGEPAVEEAEVVAMTDWLKASAIDPADVIVVDTRERLLERNRSYLVWVAERHVQGIRFLSAEKVKDLSALKGLPHLRVLMMKKAKMGAVVLSKMQHLDLVQLAQNGIERGTFAELPQLTELDLSENGLKTIEVSSLPKLRKLRLKKNALPLLPVLALPSLDSLYLTKNRLMEVDLSGLPKLKSLDLSGNQLVAVRGFASMKELDRVDLSHNKIASLSAIDPKGDLGLLDLSHNALESTKGLAGPARFRVLQLAHNEIGRLEDLSLEEVGTLDLSHNQLHSLSGLEGVKKIGTLNLSHNQLKRLDYPGLDQRCDSLRVDANPLVALTVDEPGDPTLPLLVRMHDKKSEKHCSGQTSGGTSHTSQSKGFTTKAKGSHEFTFDRLEGCIESYVNDKERTIHNQVINGKVDAKIKKGIMRVRLLHDAEGKKFDEVIVTPGRPASFSGKLHRSFERYSYRLEAISGKVEGGAFALTYQQ